MLTVSNSRFYNEANGANMIGSVVTCGINSRGGHANVAAAAAGLRINPERIENATFIQSYRMLCAQMFLHIGSISSRWWNLHFANIASYPVVTLSREM